MDAGIAALIILGALAMVVFLFRQNLKDKKKFTDQLNNTYRKPKDEEGDIDIDEIKK